MTTAGEVFRDYATADVPASGVHNPSKAEIRALLAGYESTLALVELAIAAETAASIARLELARRRALFNQAI